MYILISDTCRLPSFSNSCPVGVARCRTDVVSPLGSWPPVSHRLQMAYAAAEQGPGLPRRRHPADASGQRRFCLCCRASSIKYNTQMQYNPQAKAGQARTVADPEGGHGAMAPQLSLEGALSAPEGTLRVPEGIVFKLQQALWCPLKGFTDLLRDPLSS